MATIGSVPNRFSSAAYLGRLLTEMDHAQISIRIRESRKAAGYRNRDELADVMKVHRNTIENWEHPQRANVPYDRMEELAAALNVEKRWLLHGDEAPRSGADDARLEEILRRLESLEGMYSEMNIRVAESVLLQARALGLDARVLELEAEIELLRADQIAADGTGER